MRNEEISAFLAIVNTGSLSAAADKLFLSQSALSHRMSSLENEIGKQLIIRNKGHRNIELTDAGKAFIPIAERWESLFMETVGFASSDFLQTIRICILDSLASYVFPTTLHKYFSRRLPVSITVNTERSQDSYLCIESQQADLAFISTLSISRNTVFIPAFQEEYALLAHRSLNLPSVVEPSALSLKDEIFTNWTPDFTRWHEHWFTGKTVHRFDLDNIHLIEKCIEFSKGWAIVPNNLALHISNTFDIEHHDLLSPPQPRIYYLLLNSKCVPDENTYLLLRDFYDTLCECASYELLSDFPKRYLHLFSDK